MTAVFQNVTHACFGLGYLAAFGLGATQAWWPRAGVRLAALVLGAAGLVAHTAFLAVHHPTPATPSGALLTLAWVVAVVALTGAVHSTRQAWPVFTLPVILGLVGLSRLVADNAPEAVTVPAWLVGENFWGAVHGLVLLGAAVGLTAGFLASVMYLVQARRLLAKRSPLGGVRLLSLERLETLNRRAVNSAFPLLTIGLILGAVLVRQPTTTGGWWSVKVLGTLILWLVCALLCYLRYAAHVPGRRLARLTIAAFVLTVLVLASAHPFAASAGAGP